MTRQHARPERKGPIRDLSSHPDSAHAARAYQSGLKHGILGNQPAGKRRRGRERGDEEGGQRGFGEIIKERIRTVGEKDGDEDGFGEQRGGLWLEKVNNVQKSQI